MACQVLYECLSHQSDEIRNVGQRCDCGGQPALADRSAQMVREICTVYPLVNGFFVTFVFLNVYHWNQRGEVVQSLLTS